MTLNTLKWFNDSRSTIHLQLADTQGRYYPASTKYPVNNNEHKEPKKKRSIKTRQTKTSNSTEPKNKNIKTH